MGEFLREVCLFMDDLEKYFQFLQYPNMDWSFVLLINTIITTINIATIYTITTINTITTITTTIPRR